MTSRTFYVSINGGPETPCESLGLDPIAIRRASLDIDYLEMEQHRKRGDWVTTIPHDADVRFYDYKRSTDNLLQIFMGRVMSPQKSNDANSQRRIIRVAGVGELLRELQFHRGQFVPGRIPGPPVFDYEQTSRAIDKNGHVVPLFWGAFHQPISGGQRVKAYRNQTVAQAITEVFMNLSYLLPWHGGITNVWRPQLQSLALGTNAPQPLATTSDQANYLDWLVKLMQPVPDGWMRWDYSGSRPQATVSRFSTQVALALTPGWPLVSAFVERRQHEETPGMVIIFGSTSLSVGEFNRGYGSRVAYANFPAGTPRNPLRRNTAMITFDGSSPVIISPENASKHANYAGPYVTGPQVTGSLTFANAPHWCRPGAVFTLDGLRLNTQETIHDLATDQITASVGVPRHLGADDIASVSRWLTKGVTGDSFVTG